MSYLVLFVCPFNMSVLRVICHAPNNQQRHQDVSSEETLSPLGGCAQGLANRPQCARTAVAPRRSATAEEHRNGPRWSELIP